MLSEMRGRAANGLLSLVMARPRQRLAILIYHRVLAAPDPLRPGEPDVETFRWQMDVLGRHFRVFDLAEALDRQRRGSLPARAAAITFDDGYADNLTLALPALRAHGLSATLFVATGFLDGGRMFNDSVIEAVRRMPSAGVDLDDLGIPGLVGYRRLPGESERRALITELLPVFKYTDPESRASWLAALTALADAPLPDDLMMTTGQLRAWSEAGMGVGAHTVTHPILTRVDGERARAEIVESRTELARLTGRSIDLFAYPNGRRGDDYATDHADQVHQLGFSAAVTTHLGAAGPADDRYQLPRFTPWDRTADRFLLRMARNALIRDDRAKEHGGDRPAVRSASGA